MDSSSEVIANIREISRSQIELEQQLLQLDEETADVEAEIIEQENEIRTAEMGQAELNLRDDSSGIRDRLTERERELKGRVQTLVNQINGSDTESFELVSIQYNELTAHYTIYAPNSAKTQVLFGLKLMFDTKTQQISAVCNMQNQRYLTHQELSVTMADLARTYAFNSKSLLFHQLSLQSVPIS